MKLKKILWVDDDIQILTGIEAYLAEIDSASLFTATSLQSAERIIAEEQIDLLLFDMVLMEDDLHAALGRYSAIGLAREALGHGVRAFVIYTVLGRKEVQTAWSRLIDSMPKDGKVYFSHIGKNTTSVKQVVATVDGMLEDLRKKDGKC